MAHTPSHIDFGALNGFGSPNNNGAINQFGGVGNNAPLDLFGNNQNFDFFGQGGDTPSSSEGFNFQDFGSILGALQGFGNLYLGKKGLDLSKDQFDFTKGSFNKNLANQATTVNNQLSDLTSSRLQSSGRFDTGTDAGRAALNKELESIVAPRRVSGAAV